MRFLLLECAEFACFTHRILVNGLSDVLLGILEDLDFIVPLNNELNTFLCNVANMLVNVFNVNAVLVFD